MFLFQVLDALDNAKVPYALVGGYALALHGIVRATIDIDLALSLNKKNLMQVEMALNQLGLQSRLPLRAQEVYAFRLEYVEKRNLLAWSFVDFKNPARAVDILLTEDLRQLNTQTKSVSGRKIRVATLEELLRMKQAASRPQDQWDIDRITELLNAQKKPKK